MLKINPMKKILVYSLVLLGSMVLFSMTTPAEDIFILKKKQYKKNIEKQFSIDKDGEVAIVNKYGDIDMHTWDKNEVKIKVEIIINATSQSIAEDVFETISVEFDDSKSRVYAETVIESKESYWWNWGKNLKSDFEINYEIYMPITCSINFTNKYGDVDVMDLDNNATIDVSYGNLTMGDLNGDLGLILGYGNAFVGSVKDVQAEIKYSKFRCEAVNEFMGETKYSGITINNADKMLVESKYDNFNLGHISELVNEGKYDNFIVESCDRLTVETKYSDYKLGELTESLSAELSYGGLKVKDLKKSFDRVYVESNYAGISLGIDPGTSYELNLSSKYVEVKIPEAKNVDKSEDGNEKYISAQYNKGKGGKISLEMEYGFLKIQ